jgi:ArsR family transcriptional regulator
LDNFAAADLLAALGHETRLAVFRLLVETGEEGMAAGAIGERLGLAAPTLSFHLAHLSRVGLVKGRQEKRFIFYSAVYPAMDELLAFLARDCCQGKPCLPRMAKAGACKPPAKRKKA